MDWDTLKKSVLFWVVIGFTAINLFAFGFSKFIVAQTTTKVLEKLQKEYSPSPYGPGFDPDRVNLDGNNRTVAIPVALTEETNSKNPEWQVGWEKMRGFNQ